MKKNEVKVTVGDSYSKKQLISLGWSVIYNGKGCCVFLKGTEKLIWSKVTQRIESIS